MNPFKRDEAGHRWRALAPPYRLADARQFLRGAGLATFALIALPLLAQQTPPTATAGTRLRVKCDSTVGTAISLVGGASRALPSPVAQRGTKPPATEYPEVPPRPRTPEPQSLPSVAKSPFLNQPQPLRSVVLGEWRVSPTYVDTGPFAAAEEHAYWTTTARQFVVIRNDVEALYNNGTPCSISRVRLQVSTGTEYELTDPDPPEAAGKWPDEARRSTWVFAVKPGEKPAALVIARPLHDTDKCPNGLDPNGLDSPWPKLGTDHVTLSLDGLPSLNNIAEVEQHSAPVGLGQLEIRLTAVGLAPGDWDGARFLTPKHGHHKVVISLAVKNVSEHPNCTALWSGRSRLFDNRGYEYSGDALGEIGYGFSDLLPGGTTGGNTRFETWDGTVPRLLSITRDVSWERDCAEKQHRPVDMDGGSTVRIFITGVPETGSAARM